MDHAQSTGQEMPETRITSPEHAQTVVEALWDLYLSNKHCDITIVADHHEYHVHKAVIVCTSDYFANLLEQEGDDTDKFVIPDVPPSAMEVLLEYMYTGSLCLNRSSIWSVLSGAMLFNLDTLVKSCSEYIALTADDAKKPPDKPINVSWTTLSNLKQEPLEEPPQHTVPSKHHKRGRKPKKPLKTEPTIQESATVKQKTKKIKSVYNGPKRPRGRPRKEPSSTVQIKTVKRKYVKRKKVEKKVKPVVKIRSARRKVSPMMCPVVGCDQLCNGKLRLALHKRKHSLFWRLKQVKPVEQTLALSSAFCVMMKYCEIDTSGDAKYVCLLCEKQFQYTAQYKIHFTRFHFKQRHCQSNFHLHKYPCKFFPHWWRYRKHVFRFHGDHEIQHPRPIPCKYCRRVFLYPGNVDSHMQSQHSDVMEKSQENKHVPRRKRLLPCLQSNMGLFDESNVESLLEESKVESLSEESNIESFPEESNVESLPDMSHLEESNVESLPGELKVESLPEESNVESLPEESNVENLPEESNIKSLTDSFNCTDNNYMCQICGKIFSRKYTLKRHLLTHNKNAMLKCDMCDKSFYAKYDLTKHINFHHKQEQLECSVCSRTYKSVLGLKRHMDQHENKFRDICTHCGKGFNYTHLYQAHIAAHNNEKLHKCLKCDKDYARRDHLQEHLKSCGMGKQFQCHICSKLFITEKYLKEHIQSHLEPLRHQCSKCGKRYKFRSSLLGHMKKCI